VVDLSSSKEKLEKINSGYIYKRRQGGRKRKTFEERHKRVTLYFQNKVYEEVQALREQGKITNLTEFVNNAIREYLEKM